MGSVTPPANPESEDPNDQATFVEFEVSRWYTGGSGATVIVKTYGTPRERVLHDLSVGARGLASGEDEYLWGCGFSMPFSEDNARLFDRAFGQ